MTEPVTHIGWKAIAKRLGRSDIKSTRNMVKRTHIPIYYLNRSPVLDEAIFRAWIAQNVAERKTPASPPHFPTKSP